MKKLMLLTLVLFYTANSFCIPNYIKYALIAAVAYISGYSANTGDLALCIKSENNWRSRSKDCTDEFYKLNENWLVATKETLLLMQQVAAERDTCLKKLGNLKEQSANLNDTVASVKDDGRFKLERSK